MGGENVCVAGRVASIAGSSPRGRGKHPRVASSQLMAGLIPAWAGKTRSSSPQRPHPGAHPRVGGENRLGGPWLVRPGGSSPRGRGKQNTPEKSAHKVGLIPAWAGKTGLRSTGPGRGPAHPRVGGENYYSPPETRSDSRLIPAWAGKTPSLMVVIVRLTAHPRVGGENANAGVRAT